MTMPLYLSFGLQTAFSALPVLTYALYDLLRFSKNAVFAAKYVYRAYDH